MTIVNFENSREVFDVIQIRTLSWQFDWSCRVDKSKAYLQRYMEACCSQFELAQRWYGKSTQQ